MNSYNNGVIIVDMNEVEISNEENPIIGTQALATCVGVLLYSEADKKAIVAHISGNLDVAIMQIRNIINENNLNNQKLKYKVISGCHYNNYKLKDKLEKEFFSDTMFIPFDEKEIPSNAVQTYIDKEPSHQFAFDASTGKFVTDKVFGSINVDNINNLKVKSDSIGGYFSSEQIDLLSIIQCESHEELIDFVWHCEQLSNFYSKDDLRNFKNYYLSDLKRKVFENYQASLVPHDSKKVDVLENTLWHCNLKAKDIKVIEKVYDAKNPDTLDYIREYIKNRYPNNEEIFLKSHRFVSTERDQLKTENLYDEFVMLNNKLSDFDTLLIGSGKPDVVINKLLDENDDNRFDFYFAERDLEFAYKNNKHVRLHSLLTKGLADELFVGKSKDEIIGSLKAYVKESIDFINNYNNSHKLLDGTSIIKSVDLFNEIISFDKNKNGEYENIWESKYGITVQDICDVFQYAKENKPSGVSYLYNEPFLEDSDRRKKVIEVLNCINEKSPGLIDTLGSQMHITVKTSDEEVKNCFNDFKQLQDSGYNIQITEFDMSLGKDLAFRIIGNNSEFSPEFISNYKTNRINSISNIINDSGVNLSGVSYWSLTDKIDHNLERTKTELINSGKTNLAKQLKTVYGGLYSNVSPQLHNSIEYKENNSEIKQR